MTSEQLHKLLCCCEIYCLCSAVFIVA